MERDVAALVEALRRARSELKGLRDPQRQMTPGRAVKRLSSLLEDKELDDALSRLQADDAPSISPAENLDLRVPYPWRAH